MFNLRKPKVTINLLAHDGITSRYTGVGRVAFDSLRVFCEDKKISRLVHSVNAITGKYNNKCLGFSETIKDRSIKLLKKKHGRLLEALNGSQGEVSYGDISNWRNVSISSASLIYGLSQYNSSDLYIDLCLDTPFAQTASFFQQYGEDEKKKHIFVWIPHSTVKIHKIDSAIQGYKEYYNQRLEWEQAAVNLANKTARVYVGYVGEFMREHLIREYSCEPDKLLDFTNGLDVNDVRFSEKTGEQKMEEVLDQYGIPKDKDLMLSFGRLEPYKGFDLTIKIGGHLDPKTIVTVLIAQPYSQQDIIIGEYRQLMEKYNPRGIFISDYDFDLPHTLLRWHRTKILLVPSLAEPFGLISEEARLYKNPYLKIVAMNRDGFLEQINDGKDGFLMDLTKVEESSEKINRILSLSDKETREMVGSGFARATANYNLANNLNRAISKIIEKCQGG
mgnify:CR=1 FL=1